MEQMTRKIENNNDNPPVAIVTGGSKGIGAACCRALGEAGFRVGLNFRSSEADAKEVLAQSGQDGFLLKADLADTYQIENMVRKIKEIAGRVDVLVNNAGISINNTIFGMSINDFDEQRSIVRGAWYLVKRVLRLMMFRQRSGKIINISSVTGHTGNPGQIPYTMEKAALDAMTKSLAKELSGTNILVNSISPGFIDTEMTDILPDQIKNSILGNIPLGRMGTPEEVAEVVAFLAHKGSYINGTVIHVNGGIYGG